MPSRLIKLISPLLAAAFAGGLFVQMRSFAAADDTRPFHAKVKKEVERIPSQIGSWTGLDIKLPEAAGQLLRPNVTFARRYTNTGRWASLIVIHCRDSRDMSGHYPPYCYPGNGWTQVGPPDIQSYSLWGRSDIPIAAYEFTRSDFDRPKSWVVYDFFVLPSGEFATDMDEVYQASGNYRSRPYGCAQIQVLMDSEASTEERQSILHQMLEPLDKVIAELQAAYPGTP